MNRWMSYIDLLKIAVVFLVMLCVLFFLVSCKFTELVFYEHGPSKKFYENYDMSAPDLQLFTADDILFAVDVKVATHEKYFVWLSLYSENKGKSVAIKKPLFPMG